MTLLSSLVEDSDSAGVERHLENGDLLIRLVATTKLVKSTTHLPSALIDDYVQTLRACLVSGCDELTDRFSRETGEDLSQYLVEPLSDLEPGQFSALVPDLWSAWKTDRQFYELVHAALALTFATSSEAAYVSEDDELYLLELAATEVIWDCDGDLCSLLLSRGLPDTAGGLAQRAKRKRP